jgi:phage terminase large subunit
LQEDISTRAILESLAERALENNARSMPVLFDPNFPQQEAFAKDPARLKALFCTRRSAKSYTAGLYLVQEALTNPGCNCLFIGLTRASSKAIVWKDILQVIDLAHELGAKFNQTELTMTFPNGSVIYVCGVDVDEEEMNKLLGRKYRLVCIDEASMYTINLSNLVYGVLKPAMADLRGTICLMGTASNFVRGLFYDITTGKEQGWSVHTWSAHDNPFVRVQWREELDSIRDLRPLYMDTPQFRQWYLNEWVVDEEKLVYRFNPERNIYTNLPHLPVDGWIYVLGVDTGWEDDNAFVLCGYHINDPTLYVIRTYNRKRMTFDQVVEKIQEFMNDKSCSPSKVIIDGANKQGVESMRARSAIPFEYAEKQSKVDYIEIMNGDLIQAKIKLPQSCKTLMDEMMSLVWKTKGDKIEVPKKEHPALPNHLCDAFLYAWRNGYHYHASPPEKKLVVGSRDWYAQQAEDIWEREREHLEHESALTKGDWPELN